MNATHIRGWQAAILAGLLLIGLNAGAASARLHDPDLTAQAIAAHASITHGCWLARVGTEITSKPTTPRDSYRCCPRSESATVGCRQGKHQELWSLVAIDGLLESCLVGMPIATRAPAAVVPWIPVPWVSCGSPSVRTAGRRDCAVRGICPMCWGSTLS